MAFGIPSLIAKPLKGLTTACELGSPPCLTRHRTGEYGVQDPFAQFSSSNVFSWVPCSAFLSAV
eukprot:6439468-Amphidinium_carterae.1